MSRHAFVIGPYRRLIVKLILLSEFDKIISLILIVPNRNFMKMKATILNDWIEEALEDYEGFKSHIAIRSVRTYASGFE